MSELIKADEYLDALNECRLLVFLECCDSERETCPEINHFHQVLLTPQQFKKVSDNCFYSSKKDEDLREGYEMGKIRLDENAIDEKPFDGLASIMS